MEHITLQEYKQLQQKGKSKYKAKKTEVDGIKFDSQKEANRYLELKLLEKQGLIKNIKVQVPYLLLDTIKYKGKTYPKTKYYADFQYIENKTNKVIVEDVKSEITRKDKVYRLKIKLLLSKYKDIDFREII